MGFDLSTIQSCFLDTILLLKIMNTSSPTPAKVCGEYGDGFTPSLTGDDAMMVGREGDQGPVTQVWQVMK